MARPMLVYSLAVVTAAVLISKSGALGDWGLEEVDGGGSNKTNPSPVRHTVGAWSNKVSPTHNRVEPLERAAQARW